MDTIQKTERSGFTLLEFMLALVILSILLSITILVSFNAIARTNLRSTENTLVQMIRRAQTQSQQNRDGKQWGVFIDQAGSEIITFYGDPGEHYSTQDGDDATYSFNENIIFSGNLYSAMTTADDIDEGLVFERFTGDPIDPADADEDDPFPASYEGEIIMTMYGSVRSVVVNERGVVER